MRLLTVTLLIVPGFATLFAWVGAELAIYRCSLPATAWSPIAADGWCTAYGAANFDGWGIATAALVNILAPLACALSLARRVPRWRPRAPRLGHLFGIMALVAALGSCYEAFWETRAGSMAEVARSVETFVVALITLVIAGISTLLVGPRQPWAPLAGVLSAICLASLVF